MAGEKSNTNHEEAELSRLFLSPEIDLRRLVRVYETILSTTDDFAYIFDTQGRFLYANARLLKVWAKTLDQVIGKTCYELDYPTWHADMHTQEIKKIVRDKVAIRGEVPFTGASGISGVYDYIFKPVLDARGEVELIVGTTRDVTERKKTEQALSDSEARLLLFFKSNIIGHIFGDLDGNVNDANDEYLRIIGYSREELLAGEVRWDAITPPEHLVRDFEAIEKAKQTGFSDPYEKEYIRKDGSRIWVLVGFVLIDNRKTIAFILDISGQKQSQLELLDAQSKLKAYSERLESIVESRTAKLHETIAELEHFSYAIVHDLRAPLRAMEGYADMMEEELNREAISLSKEYIRRIKIAARRMDLLISDSLNYSQAARDELALEPVNLFELINGLIQTYPNLREEVLTVQLDQRLPVVLGNQAALTQCFSNLLGNAVKFAKNGQKANVRITSEPVESSPRFARIWVEDEGVGIPQIYQDRIFGLFQRATKEREGTGLGLAIVRKVVERMNGRVGVESVEGIGSRFWVELPIVP